MSTKDLAQGLAGLGRYGDTMLVHMNPKEVAGLHLLAKSKGGTLTINPDTGMPEAFLGNFFSSMLPTIVGAGVSMIPGMQFMSPTVAGILAGAATGAVTNRKDPLMGALMGGMGGYGGANLAKSAMGLGTQAATAAAPAKASIINAGMEPSMIMPGTPEAVSMFTPKGTFGAQTASLGVPETAISTTPANLASTYAGPVAPDFTPVKVAQGVTGQGGYSAPTFASNLEKAGQNIAKYPTEFLKENAWNLAGTVGGAALSALEPSDLGITTLKDYAKNADRYDPYATLNLAGDTGLRLYASGGPVSFADGGDAMKGGGAGAMEGAGLMAVDVSDIDAKYGYNPNESGGGLAGLAATPRVPVPTVGAFADADIINNARDSYERQLIQSMMANNRFGAMIPNRNQSSVANQLNQARTGQDAQGNQMTIAPLNVASTAPTAATAATANTAPTANTLNLNRNYADGGTITSGGIRDLYGTADDQTNGAVLSRDGYGLGRLNAMANRTMMGMKKGGYLDGAGDGMSDSIPATIEGNQPARLADGEFVVPADVVSHLGNGSSKAGAKQLYSMMDRIRQARTGNKKQGKRINALKHLPA